MAVPQVEGYNSVARFFHWSIALLVLGAALLGAWAAFIGPNHSAPAMYEFREIMLFWHKSFGISVFGLMLGRLGWAFFTWSERPSLPKYIRIHERLIAKFVHYGFYVLLLGLPASGVILSQAAGFDVSFFGLATLPQFLPVDLSIPLPQRSGVQFGVLVHKNVLAYILYAMLALHFIGVAKHHFIDRDHSIIRRMWPRRLTPKDKLEKQ